MADNIEILWELHQNVIESITNPFDLYALSLACGLDLSCFKQKIKASIADKFKYYIDGKLLLKFHEIGWKYHKKFNKPYIKHIYQLIYYLTNREVADECFFKILSQLIDIDKIVPNCQELEVIRDFVSQFTTFKNRRFTIKNNVVIQNQSINQQIVLVCLKYYQLFILTEKDSLLRRIIHESMMVELHNQLQYLNSKQIEPASQLISWLSQSKPDNIIDYLKNNPYIDILFVAHFDSYHDVWGPSFEYYCSLDYDVVKNKLIESLPKDEYYEIYQMPFYHYIYSERTSANSGRENFNYITILAIDKNFNVQKYKEFWATENLNTIKFSQPYNEYSTSVRYLQ